MPGIRIVSSRLEMNHEADRDARAVGVASRRVQPDIVDLRPQSKMWQQLQVDASSDAVGELIRGTAAAADRNTRAAEQPLDKGSDARRIAEREARPKHIRVCVE